MRSAETPASGQGRQGGEIAAIAYGIGVAGTLTILDLVFQMA